ncbi:MAG: hypothetical protein DVB23_000459 [Verrucomicrobia bacterium]|jgi:hypothetical protein|nr:MAG: hypothetical protein DVB23_000459 [Verrucomicrobiota bacterium]
MAFKPSMEAEKKWKRLRGNTHLTKVIAGDRFIDGIEEGTLNARKDNGKHSRLGTH